MLTLYGQITTANGDMEKVVWRRPTFSTIKCVIIIIVKYYLKPLSTWKNSSIGVIV